MRILYVSPTYYPRIGGVEYVVKSVAERPRTLVVDLAESDEEIVKITYY